MTYFKPVWCRQIEPGAENEMFSLSRKQLNFSRKNYTAIVHLLKPTCMQKNSEQKVDVRYDTIEVLTVQISEWRNQLALCSSRGAKHVFTNFNLCTLQNYRKARFIG